MGFFSLLKKGQKYADSWLSHPKLAAIFPESRVIKATKFSQKLMPFIAVFSIVWQQICAKHNDVAFSLAILTALFALCIPFQGLYWLGKRAQTPLPAQSAVKFAQISQQLAQKQVALPPIEKPTYQDLAELLQKADQHLGREFWDEL
ncbi:hypothetical protein C8D76_11815 [Pasteurella langaaensis DSM 22999]|uniref:UPF0208 membrane protein YfbV n=1 Tax=Alitibacter langaaensis DSM 22999 TaxID=1122935 RepID=A0A2U0SKM8_9PAST|nr:terminus macrodomain insulation protein YfbV [Pasteurella langaaensis]PVX31914.1 hypothetical protein C8D76_11815 [Pasteurella langaaensis DSM 22999]